MNILELDIRKELVFEKTENWLNLKIDGKRLFDDSNAAVFDELEKSSNGNGEFLIFTCTCGVADCAGWEKVQVKHESEKVIWTFKHDGDFTFEFDLKPYKNAIEKIRTEINNTKLELQPDFIVDPER